MLAKRFALFILKGRFNAYILAVLFSALPILSWVSPVIVGLVTLRKGATEGLVVLMWSALVGVVMGVNGNWMLAVTMVGFGSIPVWGLALLLKRTQNWSLVLQLIAVYAIAALTIVHFALPDLHQTWMKMIMAKLPGLEKRVGVTLTAAETKLLANRAASVVGGLQVAGAAVTTLIELFFARGLESAAFQPGLLSKEARHVQMNIIASVIAVGLFVLTGSGYAFTYSLMPIVAMPFVLSGVSVAHDLLARKGTTPIMFCFFYTLVVLMLVFVPPFLLVFALLALFDVFLNFRLRLASPAS
jgi:hypothetical protein